MNTGLSTCSFALLLTLGIASGDAQTTWTKVAPKDGGYSIEMPGTRRPDSTPGKYSYVLGDASFFIEMHDLDPTLAPLLTSGDRAVVGSFLESMRDAGLKTMKGTGGSSSTEDYEGHRSILFSFERDNNEGLERIVLTEERFFLIFAIGAKGKMNKADVDRFFGSFHLAETDPTATNSGGFKTVTFSNALCAKIPPVPITFEMPASYIRRPAAASAEAGCLWGEKEDLDRVTVKPEEGDFTSLNRGVFRARLSTNVVFDAQRGSFDQMDGSGEEGLLRPPRPRFASA